jgi:hypothetical protein
LCERQTKVITTWNRNNNNNNEQTMRLASWGDKRHEMMKKNNNNVRYRKKGGRKMLIFFFAERKRRKWENVKMWKIRPYNVFIPIFGKLKNEMKFIVFLLLLMLLYKLLAIEMKLCDEKIGNLNDNFHPFVLLLYGMLSFLFIPSLHFNFQFRDNKRKRFFSFLFFFSFISSRGWKQRRWWKKKNNRYFLDKRYIDIFYQFFQKRKTHTEKRTNEWMRIY